MKVWVLYDAMNEEVVGVYSTKELVEKAARRDPQSSTYLSFVEYVIDSPEVRS